MQQRTQLCTACGRERNIRHFTSNGPGRRYSRCNLCRSPARRASRLGYGPDLLPWERDAWHAGIPAERLIRRLRDDELASAHAARVGWWPRDRAGYARWRAGHRGQVSYRDQLAAYLGEGGRRTA